MGGRVLLRSLTKTNRFEKEIDGKLMVHQISLDTDFIAQFGKDVDLKNVLIRDKKTYLKLHKTR